MMPLLEIEDLHVRYGAIRALQGVSLTVGAGEIVTLIGPNGAGKSTLINTVSGLLRPAGGAVRFGGEDLTRVPVHRIVARGVIQVPEGRAILKTLSVRENLELGGAVLHTQVAMEQKVARVLERFPGLRPHLGQLAGTLSGGEQQMLAIARALMAEPKVLLMDEPSLGLAPLLVNQVFRIIRDLKATGLPILLVEQNAHKALACADRAYVLETGRIIAAGSAGELAASELVRRAYLGAVTS
jgi:branched-chain amino acid transport system ATP-binding protein